MAREPEAAVPVRRGIAQSPAFRAAALRSEVRRAYAVIGVIALVLVWLVVVGSVHEVDEHIKIAAVCGVGGLFAIQLGAIALARRALRQGQGFPVWYSVPTLVLEALMPTALILTHVLLGTFPAYGSLTAPPVLTYGIMLALTTLRLDPRLCILGGAVSAASYTAVLLYVRFGLGLAPPGAHAADVAPLAEPAAELPYAVYLTVPMLILITGLAAAWVSREVRGHVEAALTEAETRRRMDLLERDLSVARSIQQALLPREHPAIPGLDIAGWNRPADQTGGDYYDWQALPDGNWIVTLADVSGHGIGPAMVTAACRAYMRASSSHHPDLASLATHVNRLLADDLPDGRFVTMVSVLIDPRGGPLALLSAGHGPIVLYLGSTGEVRDILPQDVPLAVDRDQRFAPARSVPLARGDVLALVTDGFVEWSRPVVSGRAPAPTGQGASPRREQFGMERLRESLRRHARLSAAEMINAVAADVAAFAAGEPQQDDLTMVVVRRT